MTSVSIVVPTRNRLGGLQRALASVDAQGFADAELLVVDNGSTDGTAAWLAARRPATRVLRGDGARGAGGARNIALAEASGHLIAFLDDDDRWRAGYLAAQVGALEERPEVDVSFSDHVEIDARGHIASPDFRPLRTYPSALVQMLAEGGIHTMSVVVCRRALFERCGRFDESLAIVQDLDWYARALSSGGVLRRLPRALVERGVPGGLVTVHRAWYREERAVHARILQGARVAASHRRLVRAARALLFARIGLAKGDLGFGSARLAEALAMAPLAATRLAAVRLLRNWRQGGRRAPAAWDAAERMAP